MSPRTSFRPLILVAMLLGPAACDPDTTVELRLRATPPGTQCVFFTAGTDRTTRVDGVFDAAGGVSATLTAVTAGVGYFSAEAFQVPCRLVDARTRVNHSGGPTRAVVVADTSNVVTLDLVAAEAFTFSTRFPDESLACFPSGAACNKAEDCCSRNCAAGPTASSPLSCAATEPPGASRPLDLSNHRIVTNPEVGGGVSFPAFDGDWVFVSYPRRRPRPTGPVMDPMTAFNRYVAPALQASGQRVAASRIGASQRDQSLRELPGASFAGLVEAACHDQGPLVVPPLLSNASGLERAGDETSREVCSLLQSRMSTGSPVEQYLSAALGVSVPELEASVNKSLGYWMFPQRVRGIALEHKGMIALTHDKGVTASSVFGAALNSFQIVNDVGLGPLAAVALGRADLIKQLGLLGGEVRANREAEGRLVLLPHGIGARSEGLTALRFAYRATVAAARQLEGRTDVVAFTIWVDAQDGRLLKYAREGGDGLFDPFPWCRDPSTSGGFSSRCMMPFEAVDFEEEQVTLSNGAVNVTVVGSGATECDVNLMFNPLPCETHDFRSAHLRGQLDRILALTQHGGVLQPFGPLSLVLDANGSDNTANFDTRTLTLIKGPDPGRGCGPSPTSSRSGAEDGTIIAHEIGHLVTAQLQLDNRCLTDDCPYLNPNNRSFFHDYADGLAAMWTQTPCIGGWVRTGASGTRAELAAACAAGNESSGLPRVLYADDRGAVPDLAFGMYPVLLPHAGLAFVPPLAKPVMGTNVSLRIDRFPEHRRIGGGGLGDYADGQIVGAAFWHLWQGMYSLVNDAASPVLWSRINRGIWSTGFAPTSCIDSLTCDINIYRAARELLIHLGEEWKETDAGQSSMNKLLAAFARAGVFAVPPMCLDSDGVPADADDPLLCEKGHNAGDAIVVADDRTENDGRNQWGIRLADDDFIAGGPPSNPGPLFRVWTGPRFEFDATGTAVDVAAGARRCNGFYQVSYRLAGNAATERSSGWQTLPPDVCYGEWSMDAARFQELKSLAGNSPRIEVEYWVETSFDAPGDGGWTCELQRTTGMEPTRRSSLCPGGGVWSLPSGWAPSKFFINGSGLPP